MKEGSGRKRRRMAEAQRGDGQEGRWGQRDQEGTSKNKTSIRNRTKVWGVGRRLNQPRYPGNRNHMSYLIRENLI